MRQHRYKFLIENHNFQQDYCKKYQLVFCTLSLNPTSHRIGSLYVRSSGMGEIALQLGVGNSELESWPYLREYWKKSLFSLDLPRLPTHGLPNTTSPCFT